MAKNKVVYGGETVIDLTDTTATVSDVVSGTYFYGKDGVRSEGELTFVTYYTGSGAPSSSLGNDGDIYLRTS